MDDVDDDPRQGIPGVWLLVGPADDDGMATDNPLPDDERLDSRIKELFPVRRMVAREFSECWITEGWICLISLRIRICPQKHDQSQCSEERNHQSPAVHSLQSLLTRRSQERTVCTDGCLPWRVL